MSGKEHRALQRCHLGVIANAPEATSDVICATRALLDYLYLAQYPSHSEKTLGQLSASIEDFHIFKDIWIENGSRQGKNGVIDHQDIPKIHVPHHMVEDIRMKGSLDNITSETQEHLHREYCKRLFLLTNRKGFEEQMAILLNRIEKVEALEGFLAWTEANYPPNPDEWDSDDEDRADRPFITAPDVRIPDRLVQRVRSDRREFDQLLRDRHQIARDPSRRRMALIRKKPFGIYFL